MYRDAPPTGPVCYKHASAAAGSSCERCARPLCEPCLIYDLSAPHCIDCARRARRRRALGAVAKIAGVCAAVAGAVVFVATRPASFDYGADTLRISELRDKVQAERCDKPATLAYEQAILNAGDHRAALADSDQFFRRCEDWYRLRWVRYTARERLGEHAAAVDEATRLIAHDPEDHDYRWWRGLAYEELGRSNEAIADYKKTLELLPSADAIPFNLATLLEKQGRVCEARDVVLQFVQYHADAAATPRIVSRLERLTTACAPPPPPPAYPGRSVGGRPAR